MKLARRLAFPPLRPFVGWFTQRNADLRAQQRLTTPPARPDQMIEIYLGERYGIGWPGQPERVSPHVAVIGPQSRPGLTLRLSGQVDVFTIHFRPTALHRLFRLPMPELLNDGVEFADLLGRASRGLHEAVASAATFETRAAAAEHWLMAAAETARPETMVDRSALLLLRSAGGVRIADLAARSDLSLRHFERRFAAAVGMSPKLYGRTARLAWALSEKRRSPHLGWAVVAAVAGYADQAHLVRECTALAGAPPQRFVSEQGDGGKLQYDDQAA